MTEAASLSQGSADLPLEITTFVGRRSDRRRLRGLMAESRLVTLTGLGGVGKTRLALRMATELRRVFEAIYVVSLAGLADPKDVPDQIAAALGLHGRTARSATSAAVEYLKTRKVLLVLDNCEHVVEMAAVVADTLIRNCPHAQILATSREPLRIDGEIEYSVAGLPVPPHGSGDKPLHQIEAVQLFLDRARAVVPDFTLTEDNRAAVSAITRKLEGIPLAIELATARLRTFSPVQLNEHLTDHWELLSRGNRTAAHRHSTMAACIEWSFDLCTPGERVLWAEASVFVDGFDFDAAAQVCSDTDDGEAIAERLASLVEKSVLISTHHQVTNRYRMLPPIRRRGRVEVELMGQEADLRRRHKDFYLGLVARAHEQWFGPRQPDWIGRLRLEMGNIGKALELCSVKRDYADQGLRAGADLMEFGLMEGRYQQSRQWFAKILSGRTGDPETRALALRTASIWAAIQGDIDAATSLLEEGHAIATRLDGETQTILTQAEGFVALFAGDPTRAEQLLSEARRGLTASGNQAELAFCLGLLALDRILLDDLDRALGDNRACLAMVEAAGETWLRSWALWIGGLAQWRKGDTTAAKELVTQSMHLKRMIAEPLGIAVLLETLAWLGAAEPERAAILLGAAQNEWDKIDTSPIVLPVLDVLRRETVAAIRTQLGEAGFDLAYSHGLDLDQTTAIARALGEHPSKSRRGSARPSSQVFPSVLTRRERQVAELIHKGLSNREIAETLVISPRTAETHVENILTKLGFTNRTQVATWVGEWV